MRPRYAVGAALLAVLVFLLWGRRPDAVPIVPMKPTARTEVAAPAVHLAEPCEDLAVADALLAVTRAEIEGRPEAFPADAAPGVSPEAFLADLADLKRECPGVSVDHVDCDEYPCLAFVSAMPCPAKETFRTHDVRVALGLPNGDIASWDVLYRMQPNERLHAMRAGDVNRFDRTETRRRAALAALEMKTSGAPLTEVERATEDAAITRSQLEVMKPDDAGYEALQRRLDDAERRVKMARHAERDVVPSPVLVPVVERAAVSTCAEAVAQRLEQIDELRRAAYGDPVPFPEPLDPIHTPEAVESRARRVMTECPELGWTLHEVDCSEYPCITFWDGPDWRADSDLDDCPAWDIPHQSTMMHTRSRSGPDGGQIVALTQFASRPDDTWDVPPPGGRISRFDLRTQSVLDDLDERVLSR